MACFVAVILVCWASDLCPLRHDPPFTRFYPVWVVLHINLTFLPKVLFSYYLNQLVIIPAFHASFAMPLEQTLHMLDVRRALAVYISWMCCIHMMLRLFTYHKTKEMATCIITKISQMNCGYHRCEATQLELGKLSSQVTKRGVCLPITMVLQVNICEVMQATYLPIVTPSWNCLMWQSGTEEATVKCTNKRGRERVEP